MDACFAIGHRMFVANSHVRNCERRDQVFVGCVESSRRTGPAVVVRIEDSTHPTELKAKATPRRTLLLRGLRSSGAPHLTYEPSKATPPADLWAFLVKNLGMDVK